VVQRCTTHSPLFPCGLRICWFAFCVAGGQFPASNPTGWYLVETWLARGKNRGNFCNLWLWSSLHLTLSLRYSYVTVAYRMRYLSSHEWQGSGKSSGNLHICVGLFHILLLYMYYLCLVSNDPLFPKVSRVPQSV
jgi:hypothetical protein